LLLDGRKIQSPHATASTSRAATPLVRKMTESASEAPQNALRERVARPSLTLNLFTGRKAVSIPCFNSAS